MKPTGSYNLHGKDKTISMGHLANNFLLIKNKQKTFRSMSRIFRDMEVVAVFNPILMRDMDIS